MRADVPETSEKRKHSHKTATIFRDANHSMNGVLGRIQQGENTYNYLTQGIRLPLSDIDVDSSLKLHVCIDIDPTLMSEAAFSYISYPFPWSCDIDLYMD